MNHSGCINQDLGTQLQLAKSLGITPIIVHQWSKGGRQINAEPCPVIETCFSGSVTRYELRPDVFRYIAGLMGVKDVQYAD